MSYFVFDNIDTRNYTGVYVSFDNVDRTPKRVYEEIEIPARNGKLYIDQKRYEDVEHIYHVIALTKSVGSQLINDLASKVGYCKLQDGFNTNESYEAVFTSGAEVDITPERDTNKFKVTFTRKPQRFLSSGSTATSVANNGTLSNPSKFDSSPLIQFNGRGNMNVNGYPIQFTANDLGEVLLANGTETTISPIPFTLNNMSVMNTGDDIVLDVSLFCTINNRTSSYPILSIGGGEYTGTQYTRRDWHLDFSNGKYATVQFDYSKLTFKKGTTSTISGTAKFSGMLGYASNPSNQKSYGYTFSLSVAYNGSNHSITVTWSLTADDSTTSTYTKKTEQATISDIIGISTQSSIQSTVYIDCDIGEAYTIINNNTVSVNSMTVLGSELPKLKAGTNTITYDNTFSNVKITPRWWQL